MDRSDEGKGSVADRDTMQRLVTLRAETQPTDAIPYLRDFAEQWLRHANRNAYRECARWLLVLRAAHEKAGTEKDFTAYVRRLRAADQRRPPSSTS